MRTPVALLVCGLLGGCLITAEDWRRKYRDEFQPKVGLHTKGRILQDYGRPAEEYRSNDGVRWVYWFPTDSSPSYSASSSGEYAIVGLHFDTEDVLRSWSFQLVGEPRHSEHDGTRQPPGPLLERERSR